MLEKQHCLLFSGPNPLPPFAVSNAGLGMIGPVESQSISSMQRLFDTNFFGLVRLVKEIFPDMKQRRQGHIIVMSSVLGLQGEILLGRQSIVGNKKGSKGGRHTRYFACLGVRELPKFGQFISSSRSIGNCLELSLTIDWSF